MLEARGDHDTDVSTHPVATRLEEYFASLSHDELVGTLLDLVGTDPVVAQRLELAAAEAKGDLTGLQRQVDAVLRTRRYLDYRDAIDYERDAGAVLRVLDRTASGPAAAAVVPIVERALKHVVAVLQRADDSSGSVGGVAAELLAIHATACRRGRPDPQRLARWLIKFGIDDQDWFAVDVRDYADVLGSKGLQRYRRELDKRAQAQPSDFRVRQARQNLALLDEDVDAIVELFGGDLSTPYHYQQVAEALRQIACPDEAFAWVLRGLALPMTWQSRILLNLAAGMSAEKNELHEASRFGWVQLQSFPDLESYSRLRSLTRRAGTWDVYRDRALNVLAKRNAHEHVRALLSDDDVDAAWAAAQADGADPTTYRDLAQRRAESYPDDAASLFRAFAEEALVDANRQAYREAVTWLRRLRKVEHAAGKDEEFASYIAALRREHRRRPSFQDELDRARL
jgi:hypothetical protein